MGIQDWARRERVDAWLAKGGTALAATERAARSITSAYHDARLAERRPAWLTPAIFSWDSWVRERWAERNESGMVLLNTLQEQALWSSVIGRSEVGEGLLHPRRLAAAAQDAYRLLCGFAPASLKLSARTGWTGDAAIFSEWIGSFEARCREEGLITEGRIALELATRLNQSSFEMKKSCGRLSCGRP